MVAGSPFSGRNYRQDSASSAMSLDAHDFIGRFFLHVLPRGFVRIRFYGLLATRNRPTKLTKCESFFTLQPCRPYARIGKTRFQQITGRPIDACPLCRPGKLQIVEIIPSFRVRLKNLQLGSYDPGISLSKIQGLCLIRRVQRLPKIVRENSS